MTAILPVVLYLPPFNERLLGFLSLLIGMAVVVTFGRRNDRAALMTSLFLLVALGITTGTELVYLADHLQGGDSYRMNTVFKFYEQAWIYFSLAGAMGLFYIFDGRDEALLPPLAETAAQAAVVGDDPQNLINSDDPNASYEEIITTTAPASDGNAPATPDHPYMISEWGQNGLDNDPAAAPYIVPYTGFKPNANGSEHGWAQGTLPSSNGHTESDPTLIADATEPVSAKRGRTTGPLPAEAPTERPLVQYMASEWRQTGNDSTAQSPVASNYAPSDNSSTAIEPTAPIAVQDNGYAPSDNGSAAIEATAPIAVQDNGHNPSDNGSAAIEPTEPTTPQDNGHNPSDNGSTAIEPTAPIAPQDNG